MTRRITSLHNPRIKLALQLRRSRGRKQQNRIIIDGVREIERALQCGVALEEVFYCPEDLHAATCESLLTLCCGQGVFAAEVSSSVLAKLAYGQRAEGIVATARRPATYWPPALPPQPLVIVAERLEKPGNLGGIVRTADAVGAHAVLAADSMVDLFHPNVIRASLGTVFRVPVATASSADVVRWLQDQEMQICAARVDGQRVYTEIDYRQPTALVVGNEADGLSPVWHGPGITPVVIPMLGLADSLNVSVTAAVLMYEALRQRQTDPPIREP